MCGDKRFYGNCLCFLLNFPVNLKLFLKKLGTALAAQWLRLHASTARGWFQSPVSELRSHMLLAIAKKVVIKFIS